MKLHREGYKIITIALFGLTALNCLFFLFIPVVWLVYTLLTLSLVFFFLILQFFRDPGRVIVRNNKQVLAPADGKVVVIEEVEETEYLKDRRKQVSIFMSPLNVHINRNPVSGIVKYAKYHPGKYLVAWHPKSSTENERTTLVIQSGQTPILFRQIAGAVARRIRFYIKEGQEVDQGVEMGFIKFGSRVDIYLPLDAEIKVKLNDISVGGETVIAVLN
jgi:phosphatidylserine decarboxylase